MKKKPNIVVFMTDQQLADTITSGHIAKTPNVDRLKARGVHFTDAYCPAPHCCPSRATFFTGLYPSEHNIWNNVEVNNAISRTFYDDVLTFPEQLSSAGYQTIFAGKWHVSGVEGPADRGFDEVLCEYISNHGRSPLVNRPHTEDWEKHYSNPEKVDFANSPKEFGRILREGYPRYFQFGIDNNPFGDMDTVQAACERVKADKGEAPFFMYVGTVGPHDPYCPPQEFLDLYDIDDISLPATFYDEMADAPALYRRTRENFKLTEQEHKESIRRYLAFCSYEDSLFGKLLDTLEQEGKMDDTIVIYLSDHGDYLGAHGLWAKGLPCYREAYHICAVVGGGGIAHQEMPNRNFLSLADFAPSILELAGICPEKPMTGASIVPLLSNETPDEWRTECFTQTNGNEIYGIQRAVWNKKWKLVYNSFDYDQLFDLENDPEELHNVIKNPENADVLKMLWKKLWLFAKEHQDPITSPYIMVSMATYGPGIVLEP